MHILILENHPRAPAGLLEACIADRGWSSETIEASKPNSLPADLSGIDGVVALGGLQDAWDDAANPHFDAELQFLYRCDGAGIPVLGICLGAQLLARAFGATVHRMPNGAERGLTSMLPAQQSSATCVLFPDPAPFKQLSWHQDMFHLPQGAELILSSAHCAHQGFFVGNCSFGLQCHPEATLEMVSDWVSSSDLDASWVDSELKSAYEDVMRDGKRVLDRWLMYVGRWAIDSEAV